MSGRPDDSRPIAFTFQGTPPPWKLQFAIVFIYGAAVGVDSAARWMIAGGLLGSAVALRVAWQCSLAAARALGVVVPAVPEFRCAVATHDDGVPDELPDDPEEAAREVHRWALEEARWSGADSWLRRERYALRAGLACSVASVAGCVWDLAVS